MAPTPKLIWEAKQFKSEARFELSVKSCIHCWVRRSASCSRDPVGVGFPTWRLAIGGDGGGGRGRGGEKRAPHLGESRILARDRGENVENRNRRLHIGEKSKNENFGTPNHEICTAPRRNARKALECDTVGVSIRGYSREPRTRTRPLGPWGELPKEERRRGSRRRCGRQCDLWARGTHAPQAAHHGLRCQQSKSAQEVAGSKRPAADGGAL